MNEEEFDSLKPWRAFRSEDAAPAETQFGRYASLAKALWGRTPEDLQSRLESRHPEIPAGFQLADFRALRKLAEKFLAACSDPHSAWFSRSSVSSLPMWEARCTVARRAIEYLENPPKS